MKIFENIVRDQLGVFHVRAWISREESGPNVVTHRDALRNAGRFVQNQGPLSLKDPLEVCKAITDQLTALGHTVNAIEVSGPDGGALYYPDWP